MKLNDLSPEIQQEMRDNAATFLNDDDALQQFSQKAKLNPNEIIKMVTDLSQPSSPKGDNHETGFWKGAALTSITVLAGIFALALKGKK